MRPKIDLPNKRGCRSVFCAAALLIALALSSCESGGHFTVLGYTTRPNYDESIKTVRVPIFENRTFRRGLEFDLTRAVIREIELKTPYKVVQGDADTELKGTIISYNKNIINRNQLNEVREAETTLAVELVWKDLRSGEILTRPLRPGVQPVIPPQVPPLMGPGASLEGMAVPVTPDVVVGPLPPVGAPPPGAPPPQPPVLVQSVATFIPELGGSITSAYQRNVDRLAVQIVSMMEKAW
jgi:hypothetical protein